ncbi:MAG: aminopeptidase [Candidatus Thorarchaeota archaeon]
MDPRVVEHARVLVDWSTAVKRGEMVTIRASPESHDLAVAVMREVTARGARALVLMDSDEVTKAFYDAADSETIETLPRHLMAALKESDVYISLGAPLNTMSLASVDMQKQLEMARASEPLSEVVLSKRWCGTVHPCRSLAQQAGMSLQEYQDFVYDSVLIDWASESKNWYLLKEHLESHSDVRFVGPETDLYARTEGRVWVASDGKHNMPSGEVFTAPVEDSVEGKVYFDIPFMYQGRVISGVRLRFERGIVVDYSAEREQSTLKAILEVDEGASRLGEVAIGTNRGIKRYTLNMLFDEKIGDTIHCALGRAYEECKGVNKSAVHVDMVKNMREGRIVAGDEVIYERGKFFYER